MRLQRTTSVCYLPMVFSYQGRKRTQRSEPDENTHAKHKCLQQNDLWLECHHFFCLITGPVRRVQKHTLRRPRYVSGYCKSTGHLQTCLLVCKFPTSCVFFLLCVFPFLPCCWVTLVCVTCNSSLFQDLHGLVSKQTVETWLKKKII